MGVVHGNGVCVSVSVSFDFLCALVVILCVCVSCDFVCGCHVNLCVRV